MERFRSIGCFYNAAALTSIPLVLSENIQFFLTVGKLSSTLIIDLRDEVDYEKSHIDISINMPYTDNGVRLLSYLQKKHYEQKNIYLICYKGHRAAQAFNLLKDKGFKRLNYITFGYDEFCETMGDSYIPSNGECSCKNE